MSCVCDRCLRACRDWDDSFGEFDCRVVVELSSITCFVPPVRLQVARERAAVLAAAKGIVITEVEAPAAAHEQEPAPANQLGRKELERQRVAQVARLRAEVAERKQAKAAETISQKAARLERLRLAQARAGLPTAAADGALVADARLQIVTIAKEGGLGLQLDRAAQTAGGFKVAAVVVGGAASAAGGVAPGFELVAIGGQELAGLEYAAVVKLIKQCTERPLTLGVLDSRVDANLLSKEDAESRRVEDVARLRAEALARKRAKEDEAAAAAEVKAERLRLAQERAGMPAVDDAAEEAVEDAIDDDTVGSASKKLTKKAAECRRVEAVARLRAEALARKRAKEDEAAAAAEVKAERLRLAQERVDLLATGGLPRG